MDSLARIALGGLLAARLAVRVAAQATTTVVCTTDLWTQNKEGASPCLVAASLQAACNGGKFSIPALTPGRQYTGPELGFSNVCTCSTVTYSMVAACGACQDQSIDTWTDWRTNCTDAQVSVSSFPLNIPSGTTVPSWAYLDVTVNGVWDASAADAAHNNGGTDSTATAPTATASLGGGGSSSSSSSSHSSHPPVAAIAGGVVGGVVALLLIGGLVFFLVRRNKRRRVVAPSTQFAQGELHGGEKVDSVSGYPPPSAPMPYYVNANQTPSVPQVQEDHQKLYDPADPSTFPSLGTPAPSLPGYTSPAPSSTPYSGGPPSTPYVGQVPSTPYTSQAPSTLYGGQAPSVRYSDTGSYLPEPGSPTGMFSQQMSGGSGYAPVPTAPPNFGRPQGPGGGPGQGYMGTPEV